MKVLTVLQPWASLIVYGCKRWELRSWPTPHRGRLAIHAGRRFDAGQRRLCAELPVARWLAAIGIRSIADLPRGMILGSAAIVDCIPASDLAVDERGSVAGGFAWRLAEPRRLPTPVAYRGQLGLCELPPEITAMVQELACPVAGLEQVG